MADRSIGEERFRRAVSAAQERLGVKRQGWSDLWSSSDHDYRSELEQVPLIVDRTGSVLRRAASIARKYDLAAAYEHNEDRTAWSLWLDLRWEHDGREVGFRLSQRTYDIPGSLEATYLLGPNVSLTGSKLPLAEAKPAELWRLVGDWAEQVLPG